MQATTIFLLASVTYGTAMPQFGGFLGNIFGGFLGNRGNRGPTGQAAPAFGASQSGGGSRCGGGNSPNHQFGGQNFLLSWRIGNKISFFCIFLIFYKHNLSRIGCLGTFRN